MERWPSRIVVADVHREVFFLSSGGARIYGSLYAATSPSGPGLVVCPSIGVEFAPSLDLAHAVARGLASAGGAGIVMHPPGHGDSHGEPEGLTIDTFVGAAEAVASSALERVPGVEWGFAGIRIGAAPSAVAASSSLASFLLLIEPVFDPSDHLARLERSSRRAALDDRAAAPNWAFGFPLPEDRWEGVRDRMLGAIRSFRGDTFCVAYAQGDSGARPAEIPTERVPGTWTLAGKEKHEELAAACIRRLSGKVTLGAG